MFYFFLILLKKKFIKTENKNQCLLGQVTRSLVPLKQGLGFEYCEWKNWRWKSFAPLYDLRPKGEDDEKELGG